MKILSYGKDGGKDSPVMGFWLIEIKSLFSIVLLQFNPGVRENYHSHAFNAFTWWLRGSVLEYIYKGGQKIWTPSIWPKFTPRSCVHKIYAVKPAWAISFRGPWETTWKEVSNKDNKFITLTHGRKIVENIDK